MYPVFELLPEWVAAPKGRRADGADAADDDLPLYSVHDRKREKLAVEKEELKEE